MAKIIIVLRRDKINKKSLCPINFKITSRGKKKYISTGYSVKETEWEKAEQRINENHPNYEILNRLIYDLFKIYQRELLEINFFKPNKDIGDMKNKLVEKKDRMVKKTIYSKNRI